LKYPDRNVRVAMAADSPYPNAKVYSMQRMEQLARGEVLVISDSDVSVTPDYLHAVIGGFANPEVGVVTCLYRGAPGHSVWSRLEALGMSTRFMPGVLVAWLLEDSSREGMQFALGPTMAIRRQCLEAIGGFPAMANYLADDFVLGKWASERGYRVMLSSYVLDHHVLGEGFLATFKHQLRWARSSRCSRPLGYIGELFTHPTALAGLLAWFGLTHAMPVGLAVAVVAGTLALRWWVAAEVGAGVLRDPEARSGWWLVPLGDLLGFVVWFGGFTGRTIHWRGIAYHVGRDGRFEPIDAAEPVVPVALTPVAEDKLATAPGDHVHGTGGQ
jgi:ceramide glucosyltransferase